MAGIAPGKIPRSHWVCAGLPATGEGMSCHYIATRGKLNAAALSYGNVGGGRGMAFPFTAWWGTGDGGTGCFCHGAMGGLFHFCAK